MVNKDQSKQLENTGPDYKKIYSDIIERDFPDKKEMCKNILSKTVLSQLDVIEINTLIFGNASREISISNQKHRSYNKQTILQILEYQQKNCLNNTQLAQHFRLSRNSVTHWKKKFKV
ncbi:helix-turn-helix domain-containing protein [Chryseobacterium luteum]|uniref:helix-turn-helix domain-containing protein n=1 Tax=Chryseobacterium luteum TaxID=421531 RepID=UPI000A4FEF10|nr:helix-turn-helix domain-containing protein [Chryseobacterium luteum]